MWISKGNMKSNLLVVLEERSGDSSSGDHKCLYKIAQHNTHLIFQFGPKLLIYQQTGIPRAMLQAQLRQEYANYSTEYSLQDLVFFCRILWKSIKTWKLSKELWMAFGNSSDKCSGLNFTKTTLDNCRCCLNFHSFCCIYISSQCWHRPSHQHLFNF